jgi:hypothetical protein
MATKTSAIDPSEVKRRRDRSPNYPTVGLENAVERLTKLYQADGRAGAPVESAVKHIGFSSKHGQAMSVLSALRKFGLTEVKGGRIVPTKLAIEIVTFPPGSERRDAALREAALNPGIYSVIVEEYRACGQIPSDDSLKPLLVTDRGFNPKVVAGFVDKFRKSLEYAGLLNGNVLQLSMDDEGEAGTDPGEEGKMAPTTEMLSPITVPPSATHPANRSAGQTATFPLDEGMASLSWPEGISPESFEDFDAWLRVMRSRIARSAGVQCPPNSEQS